MSAAVETYRDDMEATYSVDFTRNREPIKARKRFPEYRRAGNAPTRVSGLHCRRNKRWTWGKGRGASLQNLRAFAGAIALLVAGVASNAFAVTLDMVSIGNVGNAAHSSGLGAVSYAFSMSRTETTNAQYVDFLNAVGASNPNGIYSASMGLDANGGIIQSGSPGFYTYSVRGGTNPAGVPYANVPVNFVSWFSAARFVNWLHNGQPSNDPLSLEDGSYTLNGATSGPLVARNSGATYVLPNLNEWVKAGFNTGVGSTDYTNWATNNASMPASNQVTPSATNVANYGFGPSSGPLAVGSYTNSASFYGLYEMMGNIAEMTETPNAGNSSQWIATSGSFATSLAKFPNFSLPFLPNTYVNSTALTSQIGFRVAAVPEPGTIALAGAGLAGLAGIEWKRRRKVKAASIAA